MVKLLALDKIKGMGLISAFVLLSATAGALAATPLPASHYSFAPPTAANDRGEEIILDDENAAALNHLLNSTRARNSFLIVPGYADGDEFSYRPLHEEAKKRVRLAYHYYRKSPDHTYFIFTGGNVSPRGTPFNEALEMKRYAMAKWGVPEKHILIEPYAKNSVTNLRNTGRLLLALGTEEAQIITSPLHRFYFASSGLSTFSWRARRMLGYLPGETKFLSWSRVGFWPDEQVFEEGPDPRDP